MATVNITPSSPKILVINQSIDGSDSTGVITTNLNIVDGFDNTVGVVYVERGLTGLTGPSGLRGEVGPAGPSGPIGPSGLQGPPGTGLTKLNVGNITIQENDTLNIVGAGGTVVSFVPNTKTINISSDSLSSQYSPIGHHHNPSDIDNFNESVDDRVANLLQPGNYLQLSYADQDLNALTISVTGLTIGTNVQAYSNRLNELSNLSMTQNKLICGTGVDKYGTISITDAGKILINDASASAQRDTLGLGDIATLSSGLFAKLSGGNSFTGTQSLGDGQLTRFSASLQSISGSGYTISQADNGKVLTFTNNVRSINVQFNNNLSLGFNCLVSQLGSGQVRFTSAGLANRLGHSKLVGQFSVATLVKVGDHIMILSGDTTDANGGPE